MVDHSCRVLSSATPWVLKAKPASPFALQLHVTERCNLRCRHCYGEEWTRQLSFDEFQDVISQFLKLLKMIDVAGTVYLTGGEPLIWPHLMRAIRYLRKERLAPRVFTNGVLIDSATAHQLARSGSRYVQVSLDGMQEHHDWIRGSGNFDRAVTGIRNLVAEGIEVTVMVTVMKDNIPDVRDLVKFCDGIGVSRIAFGRFVTIGEGTNIASNNLTSTEVALLFQQLESLRGETEIEIVARDPLWAIIKRPSFAYSGCTAGQLLLDVLTDGTVLPCRRLPIPVGNVFERSLSEIWALSPLLKRLRDRSQLECSNCDLLQLCGGCRGVAHAMTGDLLAKDPHCFIEHVENEQ